MAGPLCSETNYNDVANLDNFAAACGLVYGTPKRADGKQSSPGVSEPGSDWSVPLYSCIMTAKATIKRVTFRFNGTDDLSGIKITEINNKVYPDEGSKPLWGVERSEKRLVDVDPLWGLISSPYQGNISLYILRQESLYLPGREGSLFTPLGGYEYLPGADFYSKGLTTVFKLKGYFRADTPDYTGKTNLAMNRRWQELSGSAETTAKILNLIWTDLSSNAVVGTRGLHGARAQDSSKLEKRDNAMSEQASNTPAVKYMTRRVRYQWPYAIPAFIVLFLTVIIACAALVSILMGWAGMTQMRRFLNRTSQGRIFTTYLYARQDESTSQAWSASQAEARSSTRRWIENMGRNPVTVAEGENDFLIIDGPQTAQKQPLLQENLMT